MEKITTTKLVAMKKSGEKIVMLTGYDCSTARILDEAGVDAVLVGDSVGMVKLGYDNTLPVTMDEIIYHARAARRGVKRALLIADMPFLSYETKPSDAVLNAGRLVKEAGVEAVKIEGGSEMVKNIGAVIDAKIPVIGHLGLTPQALHKFGGYKVQGRSEVDVKKMLKDARALERAGVFMIVLECIPAVLAKKITAAVSIPTIGIGAGPFCDGQVLVTDDLVGLYSDTSPKFVKRYAELKGLIASAVKEYGTDVRTGKFPAKENSY